MNWSGLRSLVVIALAACMVVHLVGCADWSGVQRIQQQAQDMREELRQQRESVETRLAQIQTSAPASPQAEELRQLAERLKSQEAALDAARKEIDVVVQRAQGQSPDAIGQTIGTVTPWLPDAARVPVALGAAVLLSLARAAQLKKAAASIALSMDKAMVEDEAFKTRFRANASTFRSIQTPTAHKIVDEATGKSRALVRWPV